MKKDNKGFSLVELIIVIAIMAILIGVLAPTFIKYVERSRRSKDIQNAAEIQTAIQADMADGEAPYNVSQTTAAAFTGTTTITEIPKVTSSVNKGGDFMVTWNVTDGSCHVSVVSGGTTYDLTTEAGTEAYNSAP